MAEPLVLVPGMMCDARMFIHQIAAFSRQRAIHLAPTATGATIEDIAVSILATAPASFALAGAGMGGIVAMEMQRRAPDRVTRLALISTNAQSETPGIAAAREEKIVKARAGRLRDVIADDMAAGFLSPYGPQDGIDHLVMEMALDMGPDVFVNQSRAMQRRPDQQKTLRMLRIPALVLCGVHDEKTPVRRHEFMATLIPYATLEIVPDAGHIPALEQPGEINRHLGNWLNQPLMLR